MPCLLKTLSLPWLEKEDICCFSLILISTENNEGVNLHYLFIIVAHYLLYFVERRKLSTEAWQTTCYKKLSLSCHSECDLLKCPHCLHQPWSSQRGSYIEKVPAVFNKIANCKKKKKKDNKKTQLSRSCKTATAGWTNLFGCCQSYYKLIKPHEHKLKFPNVKQMLHLDWDEMV